MVEKRSEPVETRELFLPPQGCKCECVEVIEICPFCVGGLMPLVYAMILYSIYEDLGASRSIEFARAAIELSWSLFLFCASVAAGGALVFMTGALILISVSTIRAILGKYF